MVPWSHTSLLSKRHVRRFSSDALFPNDFVEDLFIIISHYIPKATHPMVCYNFDI